MRLTRFLLGAALLATISIRPVQAQNIIWYEDFTLGPSSWTSGMTALGAALPGANIYEASSVVDFFTTLAGGSWDLAVLAEQSDSDTYSSGAGTAAAYMSSGGLWLGTTWVTDGDYLGFMDATHVSSNNTSVTDNGSPYYDDVFGTSPIGLANTGWALFSLSLGTSNGAACVGTLGPGCAAVYGNGGRSLLLGPLGDAYIDANVGRDVVLGSALFLLDQPVSTVPEPATMTLLATGLAGMAAARRRKQQK